MNKPTETLTALAALVTLPELSPSEICWLVVLAFLIHKRDRD